MNKKILVKVLFAFVMMMQVADLICGSTVSVPRYPLYAAAYNGDYEKVDELLKAGSDVDARTSDGSTPLMAASIEGRDACVRRLLQGGARVDLQDNNGLSALHYAVCSDNPKVVHTLLYDGHASDYCVKSSTALMSVILKGNEEAARYLICCPHIDVNLKSPDGGTALFLAIAERRSGIVNCLLDNGVSLDESNVPKELFQSEELFVKCFESFIQEYDISEHVMRGLVNKITIFDLVEFMRNIPIEFAVKAKAREQGIFVRLGGAEKDKLDEAVRSNSSFLLRSLLDDNKLPIDQALMQQVCSGDGRAVSFLLSQRDKLDLADNERIHSIYQEAAPSLEDESRIGRSLLLDSSFALVLAVDSENIEIVQHVLKNSKILPAQNHVRYGLFEFLRSVMKNNLPMVKTLLEYGLFPAAKDSDGCYIWEKFSNVASAELKRKARELGLIREDASESGQGVSFSSYENRHEFGPVRRVKEERQDRLRPDYAHHR